MHYIHNHAVHKSKRLAVLIAAIAVISLMSGLLNAAKAPKDPSQLFADADVVVVAEVTDIKCEKQRSKIESGFGNYDWDIRCTLNIKLVEKGVASQGSSLVAHCFMIHSRKSAIESIGLQGHVLIPEIGQTVRVYLSQHGAIFSILHPNGFASIDGKEIQESHATGALFQNGYSYMLPLEIWISACIGGLLIGGICFVIRHRISRR